MKRIEYTLKFAVPHIKISCRLLHSLKEYLSIVFNENQPANIFNQFIVITMYALSVIRII